MKEEIINNSRFKCNPLEGGVFRVESSRTEVEAEAPGEAIGTRRGINTKSVGRRPVVAMLAGTLLLMLAMVVAPSKSSAQLNIAVSFGPPAIPVYVQPACPDPGYIWTPGYWAWDPDYGYYWVPGTWVPAPFVGAMWTPGYWGWYNGGYMWYPGYWGTAVGFYGGINYGYGYPGNGYYGGYWRGDRYYYNREVNHITNVNIVNVYSQRVVYENNSRVSYNGGRGGIEARPTDADRRAERGRRFGAINQQVEQARFARTDPAQRARENHGRPGVAATARPGDFRGNGAVRATRAGEPYNEPARNMNNGREGGRNAPAPVERTPSNNAPRNSAPNQRMERGAPAQPNYQRPENRNNTPPNVERNQRQAAPQPNYQRPENRNSAPPNVERNQRQAPPPETRRQEGRGKEERPSNPPNRDRGQKDNGNGPHHGR